MFAKFDEIPSVPVQDIKEKPKCCGQRITKGNNSLTDMAPSPYFSTINALSNRIGPQPLFFYYKCSTLDINMFAKSDKTP